MKLYEKLAHDIGEMIKSGVLVPGERVPSDRHASRTYGVSAATVYQAYYLLENRGLIRSRPRSGYFVCSQPRSSTCEGVLICSAMSDESFGCGETRCRLNTRQGCVDGYGRKRTCLTTRRWPTSAP